VTSALNAPYTYVNLFKWRWTDIATECTKFLGPQGYGAVQISPPAEHIRTNAWWNIYQPVNHHNFTSDMGNEAQLRAMISTCHAAGVRIYADVVFNQMGSDTSAGTTGLGGSSFNPGTPQYAFFGPQDFHANCPINPDTYLVESDTQNCRLLGMPDLNTGSDYVKGQFSLYLTTLINMGVDGFRIDAAKHINPAELQDIIVNRTTHNTLQGEQVFVTHEVIEDQDWNKDTSPWQASGTVNEFRWTRLVRDAFRGTGLAGLVNQPPQYGDRPLTPSAKATIFVDNHDTERTPGDSLNKVSDSGGQFDLANIYMLAQPYGQAQVQSGFNFSLSNPDQNAPSASPYDASGNAKINVDWDFVHRWGDIYPMVKFRSAANGQSATMTTGNNNNQLMIKRGNVGFVALNNDTSSWSFSTSTNMPAGSYCDILHSQLNAAGNGCVNATGGSVAAVTLTGSSGTLSVTIPARTNNPVSAIAIYTGQKLGSGTPAVPAAPTGVNASATSATQINVSWTASNGATSYNVYRSRSQSSGYAKINTAAVTGTSYSDTTVSPSTQYFYEVTAVNSAGESGMSASASSTTPASGGGGTLPAVPAGVNATAASSTQVNVTWTAASGATSYNVYRSLSQTGTYAKLNGTAITGTSYSDTTVTGGTQYWYKVTSVNATGESAQSSAASSTPPAGGGTFTSTYAHMYLRGTMNATGSTWGATAMTLVANNTWQVAVTLAANTSYQYKYEIGGGATWSTNFGAGSTTGVAAQSGGNITFVSHAAGSYLFQFNDAASGTGSHAYRINSGIPNGTLRIIMNNNATAQSVSFPGDQNNWSLTTTQKLAPGANAKVTLDVSSAVTSTNIGRGNSTGTMELQVLNNGGGAAWSKAWGFSSWTKVGCNVPDGKQINSQPITDQDVFVLTIDVPTSTLRCSVEYR
jgi:alpha-amylase